jgi:hypothetical protein
VINGCSVYAQLLAGGCNELNLSGCEIALAAYKYLPLSAATIKRLDLRSAVSLYSDSRGKLGVTRRFNTRQKLRKFVIAIPAK